MISDQEKEMLISSSIDFLRTITKVYGSEEGMKMWETISNAIDPDIKGKVFFKLLVGDHEQTITIGSYLHYSNKVSFIRCIREYDIRRLGLKEAKDLCEMLWDKNSVIQIQVKPERRNQALAELKSLGCTCY